MDDRDRVRVRHMLDAAQEAVQFAGRRSREDLDLDRMLELALTRLVEIVGEAAKSVSQATRDAHPEVPWRQITGTRDRLVHGYYDVNRDILWDIVAHDLPALIPQLEALVARDPN